MHSERVFRPSTMSARRSDCSQDSSCFVWRAANSENFSRPCTGYRLSWQCLPEGRQCEQGMLRRSSAFSQAVYRVCTVLGRTWRL